MPNGSRRTPTPAGCSLPAQEVAGTRRLRVFLLSGQTLLLDGLRTLLSGEPGLHVVGAADACERALPDMTACAPDVVVISGGAGDADATEAAARILTVTPGSRVIVLGTDGESPDVADLVRLGVSAYLPRQATGLQLQMVIRMSTAAADHATFSAPRELIERLVASGGPELSDLECEILLMVSMAMTNGQIASKLSLTEATVKRHMRNIFRQLDAVSRLDAVNKARKAGVLKPYRHAGGRGPARERDRRGLTAVE